jgi:hypothetical protein
LAGIRLLSQGGHHLLQSLGQLPDTRQILAIHRLPQLVDLCLDAAAVGLRHAIAQLAE